MSTPAKVIEAYGAWEQAEKSLTSTECVEFIDELVRCCRNVDETEPLVAALEKLRWAYTADVPGQAYMNAVIAAYDNWRL
jgi:hypothetical protein